MFEAKPKSCYESIYPLQFCRSLNDIHQFNLKMLMRIAFSTQSYIGQQKHIKKACILLTSRSSQHMHFHQLYDTHQ